MGIMLDSDLQLTRTLLDRRLAAPPLSNARAVVVKTFTTIGTTELLENWYQRLLELLEILVI